MFERYAAHVAAARWFRLSGITSKRDYHLALAERERRTMLHGPAYRPINIDQFRDYLETDGR